MTMTDIKWGMKRKCTECEAPFYDMRKTPIVCPKCGAVYKPVALLKSDGRPLRKNRTRPPVPVPVDATPEPAEAETLDEETDDEVDRDDDDEAAEPVEENEDDVALERSDR
jgi:uncharacterized protein (TIGR02300 family)